MWYITHRFTGRPRPPQRHPRVQVVARPALCHTEGTVDCIGLPPPIGLGVPRGTKLPGPVLKGVPGRAEIPALHAAVGPVGRGAYCGLCELIVASG